MKASMHFGAGKASHNDRRFDLDLADHIDQSKLVLNICANFTEDPDERYMSFEDYERLFYERNFSESLDATNQRYVSQRHPEKCRTMEDWLNTYKPTEGILQIGTMTDDIAPEDLHNAFRNTLKSTHEKYPQIEILNFALHMDEASPHIHFRFVIVGHDKDGLKKPLKTKGLKEMGVQRPDLSKPEGRFNNPLMTFTSDIRDIFYNEIENMGIEIDREPRLGQKHLDTLTYKKQALANEIGNLEAEKQSRQTELQHMAEEKNEINLSIQESQNAKEAIDRELGDKKLELASTQAQLSTARDELKTTLDMKARASEIHKPFFNSEPTVSYHENMLESTRAIGTEAWRHMKAAAKDLDDVAKRETALNAKEAEIKSLHDQAMADRENARQLKDDQEEHINSKANNIAQNLFDKFISDHFDHDLSNRSDRLENFISKYSSPDGENLHEVFEKQEKALSGRIRHSWDIDMGR